MSDEDPDKIQLMVFKLLIKILFVNQLLSDNSHYLLIINQQRTDLINDQ